MVISHFSRRILGIITYRLGSPPRYTDETFIIPLPKGSVSNTRFTRKHTKGGNNCIGAGCANLSITSDLWAYLDCRRTAAFLSAPGRQLRRNGLSSTISGPDFLRCARLPETCFHIQGTSLYQRGPCQSFTSHVIGMSSRVVPFIRSRVRESEDGGCEVD